MVPVGNERVKVVLMALIVGLSVGLVVAAVAILFAERHK